MKKLNLQSIIILAVAAVAIGVVYFFGPALGVDPDAHASLSAAVAWCGTLATAVAQSIFTKDSDGDGNPDLTDATPNGEHENANNEGN